MEGRRSMALSAAAIVVAGALGFVLGKRAKGPAQKKLRRHERAFNIAYRESLAFLEDLWKRRGKRERPVPLPTDLRAALATVSAGPLPEMGTGAAAVVQELANVGQAAATGHGGARYFDYVNGGALPVSIAAEWLAASFDQNAWNGATSPFAARYEAVAVRWMLGLFGLGAQQRQGECCAALVSGATTANIAALAAAREGVSELGSVPVSSITIYASAECHGSVSKALRLVGLGACPLHSIPVDSASGAVTKDSLRLMCPPAPGERAIVCLQLGHVVTGACDDVQGVSQWAQSGGACKVWLHVDGAFGLWAAASAMPQRAALAAGISGVDSFAVDLHKMLNVNYDSALVCTLGAHPVQAYRTAMSAATPPVPGGIDGAAAAAGSLASPAPPSAVAAVAPRLQNSARARGLAVHSTLRWLGRQGVAALVDRCCDCAALFGKRVQKMQGAVMLHCALNQCAVRFGRGGARDDELTQRVAATVQAEGTCWVRCVQWNGSAVMRFSVSSWLTTPDDVEKSADAIEKCLRGCLEDTTNQTRNLTS